MIAAVYAVVIYNGLVQLKHNVAKAWANIDILLKQRHDELPKLVEVCRQYSQFEQSTLAKVIAARSQVASARGAARPACTRQRRRALRAGLAGCSRSRRPILNCAPTSISCSCRPALAHSKMPSPTAASGTTESVNVHNVRVEQFPDLIVARTFRFSIQPLLEFSQNEKRDVDVKALFGA